MLQLDDFNDDVSVLEKAQGISMDEFGRNLRRLRKERGLTMEELVNEINDKYGAKFNRSMISKWENGYEATLSSVKYLTMFFNVSLSEILGYGSEEMKEIRNDIRIPIVELITAGDRIISEEYIIGYAFEPPLFNINQRVLKDLFYLKVKGDTMDKIFPKDSLVLVRKNTNIQNGDNAVLLIGNEKEAMLSRIKVDSNLLTLIPQSNNESYLPKTIDMNKESVQFIGKVIGAFREF